VDFIQDLTHVRDALNVQSTTIFESDSFISNTSACDRRQSHYVRIIQSAKLCRCIAQYSIKIGSGGTDT
jgi:hypothetical protein